MPESTHTTIETVMNNSVGGPCDFPEKISLPVNADSMKVTKRVRGGMGEKNRFRRFINKMLTSGHISEEEAKQDWAKIE